MNYNKRYRYPIFILFFFISVNICCNTATEKKYGGPYYFASFKNNFSILREFKDEISNEEAMSLKAYYVVYYSEDGKLLFDAKFINGKMEYISQYEYKGNNLKNLITEHADGQYYKTIHDENGKILVSITKQKDSQPIIVLYKNGKMINLNKSP